MESWKPVAGYEGLYEVSDRGRVKRVAKSRGSVPGRILKPYIGKNGYPVVTLYDKPCSAKDQRIHRLVLEAFVGKSGNVCNHKNGIRSDNRLENLEWVTTQQNLLHATKKLGERRGEKHWNATLTEHEVLAIHRLRKVGWKHQALADMFGVSRICITDALSGKSWSHLVPTK